MYRILAAATIAAGLPGLSFAEDAAGAQAPQLSQPVHIPVAGTYVMDDTHRATLRLQVEGDSWRIHLLGGAPVDAGPATPADCELQAEAPRFNDRLEGFVVPFEDELTSLSPQDLDGRDYRVTVTFSADRATVATDFDLCGLGADFNGEYVRSSEEM